MKTLKHDAPAMKAVQKAFDALDKAGISFSFCGWRTLVRVNGETYDLVDAEDRRQVVSELPPVMEFRLGFDD